MKCSIWLVTLCLTITIGSVLPYPSGQHRLNPASSPDVRNCATKSWTQDVRVPRTSCNATYNGKVKIIPANSAGTRRCFETQCSIPISTSYRVVGSCYKNDVRRAVTHECDLYEPSVITEFQCKDASEDPNCHPVKCPVPVRRLNSPIVTYLPLTVACLKIEDVPRRAILGRPEQAPRQPR